MAPVSYLLMLPWLAACVTCDLAKRLVPNRLTLTGLVVAALWRVLAGDGIVVLLVAALIAISDLPRTARILLACAAWIACILLGSLAHGNLATALVTVWILWELEVTGGADAKMLLALLLFVGDPVLLLAVLLAGGLQGLIGLLRKEKTIPYTVAIAAGTLVYLVVMNLIK